MSRHVAKATIFAFSMIMTILLLTSLAVPSASAGAGEPLWSYSDLDNDSVESSCEPITRSTWLDLYRHYEYHYCFKSVAISADGEYIVAGFGSDASYKLASSIPRGVYLFDKDSDTPIWNYSTERAVQSVDISADGEYIVASDYSKIYVFDKDNSTPLWIYNTSSSFPYTDECFGQSPPRTEAVISADGRYIASISSVGGGSVDIYCNVDCCIGKVYFFNRDSSTPIWYNNSYKSCWNCTFMQDPRTIAISADGEYIAIGGSDWSYKSWDDDRLFFYDRNGEVLWDYHFRDDLYDYFTSVSDYYDSLNWSSFSGDDGHFSSVMDNHDVSRVSLHEISMSADGRYIAVSVNQQAILQNGSISSSQEHQEKYPPTTIVIDNNLFYLFDRDNVATDYDAGSIDTTGIPLWIYENPGTNGNAPFPGMMTMTSTYDYVAEEASDEDLPNCHHSVCEYMNLIHNLDRPDIDISADGEYIVAEVDSSIALFGNDAAVFTMVDGPDFFYCESDYPINIYDIDVSEDGQYIITSTSDNKIHLYSKDDFIAQWSYIDNSGALEVVISADGRYIAAGYNHLDKNSAGLVLFSLLGPITLPGFDLAIAISALGVVALYRKFD